MALEDELQALIEQRREIDRALLERHASDMAVLFTDIVGSTAFFEQRGDIEGFALVRRHNDLLFPVVKEHGGRIVKTIGDSIMAVFDDATRGLACAVAMQEKLAAETGTAAVEKIKVRIGVHWGRVLRDGDDVFGDTVNTAARINSAAEGDEVLVSQALLEVLPAAHGFVTTPRQAVTAKGKSAPVAVVAVAWSAAQKEDAAARAPAAKETLVLEIMRAPGGLRVCARDPAERGTVKAYADVPLDTAEIERLGEPFATLAHDGGQAAYGPALVEKGQQLFARALPAAVRERLLQTPRRTLRLDLEDSLVHAPWELMHDGQEFLGCRFSVGRLVAARAEQPIPQVAAGADALVVVANPSGDLPHADEEGRVIEGLFSQAAPGRVLHKGGRLGRAELLDLIGRARVLHFAGHVTKRTEGGPAGLVVADGVVSAEDLKAAMAKGAPALVFANGCHASTSGRWQEAGASSLAQALLLSGVRHTLAPLWGVPDADALAFALRFYEAALAGLPLGECARRARKALQLTHRAPLSFAGYVLYGDPRETFPLEDARLSSPGRTRSGDFPRVSPQVLAEAARAAARAPNTGESTRATRTAETPAPRRSTDTIPTARLPRSTATALPAPAPASHGSSPLILGAAGGILAGLAARAFFTFSSREPGDEARPPEGGGALPAAVPGEGTLPPAPKMLHVGPVRMSVMPFQATGAPDPTLDYLKQGLAEVLVTALAGEGGGVQLVERGQIEVDLGELDFQQSKHVDPRTRAQLGKIAGCEVAVLGAYQAAGEQLRFTARFVDVESGEIIAAAKSDGTKAEVFELQDRLAVEVKRALADVKKRMRP
ncbi:MAG: CHAT domain-containing protein [Deltaproteobacteria bacterium]|nr:CHAT domain-containing protein [Deltaproteobacteria bacterium]